MGGSLLWAVALSNRALCHGFPPTNRIGSDSKTRLRSFNPTTCSFTIHLLWVFMGGIMGFIWGDVGGNGGVVGGKHLGHWSYGGGLWVDSVGACGSATLGAELSRGSGNVVLY